MHQSAMHSAKTANYDDTSLQDIYRQMKTQRRMQLWLVHACVNQVYVARVQTLTERE